MTKKNANGDAAARWRLPVERLSAPCDPAVFGFRSTAEVEPLTRGIIGQERAVRAMEFGLRARHQGYNLFLSGRSGTGRTTYALTRLRQAAAAEPPPQDWCYVYNFKRPDQPTCLCFPAGRGAEFKRDMEELVEDIRTSVRRAFDSEEWDKRRAEIVERFERSIHRNWEALEEEAGRQGFAVQRTPTGIFTIPLGRRGEPVTPEEFAALPEEEREALAAKSRALQDLVADTIRRVRNLEKEARAALRQLERETGLYAVGHLVGQLKEKYGELPPVLTYLDNVQQDIVENLDLFRAEDGEEPPLPFPVRPAARDRFLRYRVNLFVDNAASRGAPVVFETNPTYYNLFGKVEYRGEVGTLVTDFTLIKPGALHLANGGYLVLNAHELFANPFSWNALKRALKTGEIRIENVAEHLGLMATAGLKPEPMPLRVKVVIIGAPWVYHLLYHWDEDFRKLFKVRADFDVEMDRTAENIRLYASFVSGFCSREGIRHLDPEAMALVVEHSSRLAEDQEKLSTRFHDLTELIYEAASWAEAEGAELVGARHVRRAMEERTFRSNRIEEKIRELICQGTILVDTDGAAPGQVNGLAVLDLGDYVFGRPNRITARVHLGDKGIVNIERETEMSGPIHSKGVFTLSAYLAGKYAQDKPLALSASLTFEQLYDEIEGDSASSAELYALLSELSGLPVRQGIAVTGSVNQKGEIQPIGGVNEKIEGFYHVCRCKGFTGEQGVIIPVQNVRNLVLKEEVRQAVAEGRFHIWAVRTVDEGIEILTGVPAGERRADGTYPPDSVNGLVDRRLREMAEILRRYGHEEEREEGEEDHGDRKPRRKPTPVPERSRRRRQRGPRGQQRPRRTGGAHARRGRHPGPRPAPGSRAKRHRP